MQSVFRNWTRITVSISCDDNHYTTGTSTKCWNARSSISDPLEKILNPVVRPFYRLLGFLIIFWFASNVAIVSVSRVSQNDGHLQQVKKVIKVSYLNYRESSVFRVFRYSYTYVHFTYYILNILQLDNPGRLICHWTKKAKRNLNLSIDLLKYLNIVSKIHSILSLSM